MGKKLSRRTFSLIFIIAGIVAAVAGFLLHFLKVAPKKIYDLPIFLIIIGALFLLYGIFQIFGARGKAVTVDISGKAIKTFFLNNAIIMALALMVIVIAFIEPRFVQVRVLKDILAQSSTKLIIALGISLTLLIGGTDLSAGRMVGLAAVISASMMQTAEYGRRFFPDLPQISILIPVVIAIIACLFFGLCNGLVVSRFSLPPFIGTLAMMVIVYGACSLYFDMKPNSSQPIGGIRDDFAGLGQHILFKNVFDIPILIPIAVVITGIMWFILNKTIFGKNIYAIGGNRQAAAVSGINVKGTILMIFVIAAGMYGIGGVLEAARTAGATNNYGFGYELDAIAACVVGGVSLNGGVGKVRGIVIGVLIFTVIQYGLSFIGLNPYWQQVIKGVIIIAAVATDLSKYQKR